MTSSHFDPNDRPKPLIAICVSAFTSAVSVLFLLACGPQARLVGHWTSTAEEAPSAEDDQPPDEKGFAEALGDAISAAARASSTVELILEADGTGQRRNTAFGISKRTPVWWRIDDSPEGDPVLVLSESEEFGSSERWEIRFLDRSRFAARVPGLGEVVFRRTRD